MGKYVLRTVDLTKQYGKKTVLNRVNMEIRQGEIYGFIGLNGAGKSTLMRLATGLTKPTSGAIELFGLNQKKELAQARTRLGTLIESPALFPYMTAKQNLEVIRIQRGNPDRTVIDKALRQVGLSEAGKKKVKDFSLGMKQRLGIAVALMNDPEFLILDEPTNGLDPKGVIEIRTLLKKLNKEYGVTVLISSHILSEVHQLATRVGIIHQGTLLEQITEKELNEKCSARLVIKTNDAAKTAAVMESEFEQVNFTVMPDGTIHLYSHLQEQQKISKKLTENGLIIEQFTLKNETLEEFFSGLVGGGSVSHA